MLEIRKQDDLLEDEFDVQGLVAPCYFTRPGRCRWCPSCSRKVYTTSTRMRAISCSALGAGQLEASEGESTTTGVPPSIHVIDLATVHLNAGTPFLQSHRPWPPHLDDEVEMFSKNFYERHNVACPINKLYSDECTYEDTCVWPPGYCREADCELELCPRRRRIEEEPAAEEEASGRKRQRQTKHDKEQSAEDAEEERARS
jgi:hypothetical protein